MISRITCFAMNVLPERSPPINEVVQSGVVPRFVEFLARDDFPQLQVVRILHNFFHIVLIVSSF